MRKAQQAAFAAARPGVACQAIDAAARQVIEEAGFGPGYKYFTHRLGHGIGLDGHEWPYMVRGNATKLVADMTFTDEPGIYIPGELGVRHEDTVVVTADGCENLARSGREARRSRRCCEVLRPVGAPSRGRRSSVT